MTVAAPVNAAASHPPFDCAAMDGFAIHADDLAAMTLALGDPVYAGGARVDQQPGVALPIATGAPIPQGCGAVVQSEAAGEVVDECLRRRDSVIAGRNIRLAGEDVRVGEQVLTAGKMITPAIIGALACFGVDEIAVRRRPRVAILSSGDELQSGDTCIPDANAPMLWALAQAMGAEAHLAGNLPDDQETVRSHLAALLQSNVDLVVTTGGISTGPRDFLLPAIEALGAQIVFRGIRMRPGKPAVLARLADGRPLLCLPGNPLAALIAGRFLMGQVLRAMLGLGIEEGAAIAFDQDRPGTTLVLKGRRTDSGVEVMPGQRSHMVRSLIDTDCWIVTDDSGDGRASVFPVTCWA